MSPCLHKPLTHCTPYQRLHHPPLACRRCFANRAMTTDGDISSASLLPILSYDKPVVVRVKRKVSHSRLDAFWLEINERPLKRALLDFENLSLSGSSEKEGLTTKKVFVQHVETLRTSEATIDIVLPFVDHNSSNTVQNKTNSEERRKTFKDIGKQDQILVKARHEQEILAKHARFEQIWRSRKGNDIANQHTLSEMCHFYDVVRVDGDERSNEVPQLENLSQEDQKILSSYLPLLQELIPTAATEIESDIQQSSTSKEVFTDDYLYDYYTVTHDEEMLEGNVLVKVDEEDFYDGPDDSEYSSDDSNAEYNPHNDYPDEISEEEESESEASDGEDEESENEASDRKSESNDTDSNYDGKESVDIENSEEGVDQLYYDDEFFYDDDDGDRDDDGDGGNFDSDDCEDEDWS